MTRKPHILCGLVFLMAWRLAAGQATVADSPTARLLAWLLQEKLAGVAADRISERLLRVEALYSDGADYSAAALAGSWLTAGLPSETSVILGDNLRYLLAASLAHEQAVPTARHLLLELILRRPPSPFRSLAFRKLVDLALQSEDFEGTLRALENYSPGEDEQDELAYLKGRALYWLGHPQQAQQTLDKVGPYSRFRPAALYLQGVFALEEGKEQAEDFFCKLVSHPQRGKFTFMLSRHSEEIIHRAWLALARLRHDRGDYRRALDAYRQVVGNPLLELEARWESAWALYRMERYRECLDLLDQLALNAQSPWYARSLLLRGYTLVGLCEFEEAEQAFDTALQFLSAFGTQPPGAEETRALAGLGPQPQRPHPAENVFGLAHLNFRRLFFLQSMVWRLLSGFWFRWTTPAEQELAARLETELARARGLLQRARLLKNHTVDKEANKELEQLSAQALSAYQRAEEELLRLYAHRLMSWSQGTENPPRLPGDYLKVEQQGLLELASRLWPLWLQCKTAAEAIRSRRALEAFQAARQQARLAELGKVDAQMGRKQALEIEIENLALGHYPLALYRQLAEAGMLGPDTEYWPYDGEGWPDELEGK